ncbi:MAG TPA: permease prefix domain 1-containing protein, partial [Bryobacteraceae bacterium]|nr:permease prefix domain 1-containing protein [Bryobacteraceae bacterium]
MRWIYTIPLRLRSLFRRDAVEQELDAELHDHLNHLIEQNVRSGMGETEARHAARRAMDGIAQRMEECRDTRRVRFIEDFFKDLRYAARTLGRSPVFALTAMLSLALGIGANTAMFTAVDAVLWKPLPVERPDQLVRFASASHGGTGFEQFPFRSEHEVQEHAGTFDGAIA